MEQLKSSQRICFVKTNGFVMIFSFILLFTNLFSQSAKVEWDSCQVEDLEGYRVYYGQSSGNYDVDTIDVGNKTVCQIHNLIPGATYYFAITAYDLSGNESDYSDEVSYMIPEDALEPVALNDTTEIDLMKMTGVGAVNISQEKLVFEQGDAYCYAALAVPSSWRYDVFIEAAALDSAVLGISADGTAIIRYPVGTEWQVHKFKAMLEPGQVRLNVSKLSESTTMEIRRITIIRFVPIEGDIDLDGDVDGMDSVRLSRMFGKTVPLGTREDIDNDGDVDGMDLALLAKNFGKSKD